MVSKAKELRKRPILELKVENSTILTFKVIFYVKNWRNLSDFFFIEEYKKGEQLLLLPYFDNFGFLLLFVTT